MYSEHLYGSSLGGWNMTVAKTTVADGLLREKVNRLEELLVWAESCATAHGIKPPYLGAGSCVPPSVADAETDDSEGDDLGLSPLLPVPQNVDERTCDNPHCGGCIWCTP